MPQVRLGLGPRLELGLPGFPAGPLVRVALIGRRPAGMRHQGEHLLRMGPHHGRRDEGSQQVDLQPGVTEPEAAEPVANDDSNSVFAW